ncbi:MAG: RsmB/NOP family class I SAM-dependent RNA methyltransferase, partial [Pseudomonadota bacterium]
DAWLAGAPAEKELTAWARRSRFAGSGDRSAVRDIVYSAIRCRRSFTWVGGASTGAGTSQSITGQRLALGWLRAQGQDPKTIFTGDRHAPPLLDPLPAPRASALPGPVAADLPDWLWHHLTAAGVDPAAVGAALRSRAPVDLRVNALRATRDMALAALRADGVNAAPVPGVPGALRVSAGARRVAAGRAFADGLIEVQDAACQAAVAALPLRPGGQVLDLCAGGGGKSLAIAAAAPDVALTAWDISPRRLAQLGPRAIRSGAPMTIATVRPDGIFDGVLIDAPCSGSGTWRRTPEAKWTLNTKRLRDLTRTQANLITQGWDRVAPGGWLAYMTCSVIPDENQAHRATLPPGTTIETERAWRIGDPGDGFFLMVLRKGF